MQTVFFCSIFLDYFPFCTLSSFNLHKMYYSSEHYFFYLFIYFPKLMCRWYSCLYYNTHFSLLFLFPSHFHHVLQVYPYISFLKSSVDDSEAIIVLTYLVFVFCEYCFSVSALWCPLATPTILLGFLLPWTWGVSSRLLQQSAAAAPYLEQGVSTHSRPSQPWIWNSSSRPSGTRAATSPWRWGCSSRPQPLASGVE